MDEIVKKGKIANYGVSVHKISDAMEAIKFPNVKSIQIVFNIFRQKPAEEFFKEAKKKKMEETRRETGSAHFRVLSDPLQNRRVDFLTLNFASSFYAQRRVLVHHELPKAPLHTPRTTKKSWAIRWA